MILKLVLEKAESLFIHRKLQAKNKKHYDLRYEMKNCQ